eukprot:103549-Prymnesium_polylepis.1
MDAPIRVASTGSCTTDSTIAKPVAMALVPIVPCTLPEKQQGSLTPTEYFCMWLMPVTTIFESVLLYNVIHKTLPLVPVLIGICLFHALWALRNRYLAGIKFELGHIGFSIIAVGIALRSVHLRSGVAIGVVGTLAIAFGVAKLSLGSATPFGMQGPLLRWPAAQLAHECRRPSGLVLRPGRPSGLVLRS